LQVVPSAAGQVAPPVTHFFDRIDVRTAGDNQLVCSTYADTMLANLLSKCSKGRQKALYKSLNIDSTESGLLGTRSALPVGTNTFYLPLIFSGFFESFDLYLADSKADLNFDFYPAQTGIVVSGGGTIALTNFQFIIESELLSDHDRQSYKKTYDMFLRECLFVDPVQSQFMSKTLTAGSVNYFDMSAVNGLCSHHIILVKAPGASNVGNTQLRYLNIGDNEGAALDLVDPSLQSMWGAGSAVPTKYIREHGSIDSIDNDWITTTPAYHLSYADNFNKALSGVVDGAHWFDGSRQQIAMTLPAAPIAEVQSIAPSATVTAGFYRFLYKGHFSAELPYTATIVQMAAAFAAIKAASSRVKLFRES
jgi:hypothetical protein